MCEPSSYLTHDMSPDPGPALASAYVPGTPGAAWTEEEIASTRRRILQVYEDTDRPGYMYLVTRPYTQTGMYKKTCTTSRAWEGQASMRTESIGWCSMTVSNTQVRFKSRNRV